MENGRAIDAKTETTTPWMIDFVENVNALFKSKKQITTKRKCVCMYEMVKEPNIDIYSQTMETIFYEADLIEQCRYLHCLCDFFNGLNIIFVLVSS
jgi:hypothetical protein